MSGPRLATVAPNSGNVRSPLETLLDLVLGLPKAFFGAFVKLTGSSETIPDLVLGLPKAFFSGFIKLIGNSNCTSILGTSRRFADLFLVFAAPCGAFHIMFFHGSL